MMNYGYASPVGQVPMVAPMTPTKLLPSACRCIAIKLSLCLLITTPRVFAWKTSMALARLTLSRSGSSPQWVRRSHEQRCLSVEEAGRDRQDAHERQDS